ncbi:thioredoxin-like protein [Abortiporus biennis]|nr:thioredoxin-like protein [Abortiporus biennis]
MSESTRRSSRIAAQPKKEEEAPKPARAPRKKRSAEEEPASEEGKEAPVKKSRASAKKSAEKVEEEEESSSSKDIGKIDVGDSLPSVTLKNEEGEDVDVSTLTEEKGLVLFLVPKANTPGCTNQACAFRDQYPDFTALNYEVYCLSADSPNAQKNWRTKHSFPYPLLSDPKRTLIAALGAADGAKTKRSHFIFEKGGKLLQKTIPVSPKDSTRLALEFIQEHSSD